MLLIVCSGPGRSPTPRVPEIMAYQTIILKASQKYRRPSWVVYDQKFCQDAAGNLSQSWAKVEPSLYAQCFTGQAVSAENWCSRCHSLEHASINCPFHPRKHTWDAAVGQGQGQGAQQACMKFNGSKETVNSEKIANISIFVAHVVNNVVNHNQPLDARP